MLAGTDLDEALARKASLEKIGYSVDISELGTSAGDLINTNEDIDLAIIEFPGSGKDAAETEKIILGQRDLPILYLVDSINQDFLSLIENANHYGFMEKSSGQKTLEVMIKSAYRMFSRSKEDRTEVREWSKSLEAAGVSLWKYNKIKDIFVWPEGSRKIFGFPSGDGPRDMKNFLTCVKEKYRRLFNEALSGAADLYNFDCDINIKGKCRRFKISVRNTENGINKYKFCVAVDISWSLAMEETLENEEKKLQAAKDRLSNAMQVGKLAYWEYEVENDYFYFDNRFYSLFHTSAEKMGGYKMKPEEYAARFLFPEDMHLVRLETEMALSSPDSGYYRQFEHKIRYMDGGSGNISVRFYIEKDRTGKTIRIFGINQDITDQKINEARIQALLNEKELLLKEIHHRVKNNMRTVESLLSLQILNIKNKDAIDSLREAKNRISIMLNIYGKLSSVGDYRFVKARDIIVETINNAAGAFGPENKIEILTDIEDIKIPVTFTNNICIIINELVTNIFKYAYPEGSGGKASVVIKTGQNNRLSISVADNGIGLEESILEEKKRGLGLTLVKSLVENADGKLKIENTGGTKVKIKLNIRE